MANWTSAPVDPERVAQARSRLLSMSSFKTLALADHSRTPGCGAALTLSAASIRARFSAMCLPGRAAEDQAPSGGRCIC